MDQKEMAQIINAKFARLEAVDKGQGEMISLLLQQFLLLSAMMEPLITDEAKIEATKKAGEKLGELKAMIVVQPEALVSSELFSKYGFGGTANGT